jgi:hypothetical protein
MQCTRRRFVVFFRLCIGGGNFSLNEGNLLPQVLHNFRPSSSRKVKRHCCRFHGPECHPWISRKCATWVLHHGQASVNKIACKSRVPLDRNLTMSQIHTNGHGVISVRPILNFPHQRDNNPNCRAPIENGILTSRSQPMDAEEANQLVQSLNQSAWGGAIRRSPSSGQS